jgi:hypothetical protein
MTPSVSMGATSQVAQLSSPPVVGGPPSELDINIGYYPGYIVYGTASPLDCAIQWYGNEHGQVTPVQSRQSIQGNQIVTQLLIPPYYTLSQGDTFWFTATNSAGTVTSNSMAVYLYGGPISASLSASSTSVPVGGTVTLYASCQAEQGIRLTATTMQWQCYGGALPPGQSTYDPQTGTGSYTFTATPADDGLQFAAQFTGGGIYDYHSVTSNFVGLFVNQVSYVDANWNPNAQYLGSGYAALSLASDGLRLLPTGRNTDIPWMGINSLTIVPNHPTVPLTLLPSDITVKGANGVDYGPVAVSGVSGTIITLAQPINGADRVTITINNAAIKFTGELDVLPGDVNDDGVVNAQDLVLIRNQIIGSGNSTIATFGDINGDGVVDMTDFNLVRQRIGTMLP